MKRVTAAAALLAVLTLVAPGQGSSRRTVSLEDAKTATAMVANEVAEPFTEEEPSFFIRCKRRGRSAVCSVRVVGDRISARFETVVEQVNSDGDVYVRSRSLRSGPAYD